MRTMTKSQMTLFLQRRKRMDNIKYAIEGILFAAGEPVKAAKLLLSLYDVDEDQ